MIKNLKELIDEQIVDSKYLDSKKQQTDSKIKYVSSYVHQWLLVNENRAEINKIVFIDCMSNAGMYMDGDLGTSMLILQQFIVSANRHPEKQYCLLINDYKKTKIDICDRVVERIKKYKNIPENIIVEKKNEDVNVFLQDHLFLNQYIKGYGIATILFVDPFDFGTVKISLLSDIASKYYCEIIFNLFTSDYVRNGIDERTRQCIDNYSINDKEELVKYIKTSLKVGRMKYTFAYRFDTVKNTELYQIIFATPSITGLIKLKDVLWDVFDGRIKHRNNEIPTGQISLFTDIETKDQQAQHYANEAKRILKNHYCGETVNYGEIMIFVIENTMMKEGQILNYIIKPLLKEGAIKKTGCVSAKNYKKDSYMFASKDVEE